MSFELAIGLATKSEKNLNRLLNSFKKLSVLKKIKFFIYVNEHNIEKYRNLEIVKNLNCELFNYRSASINREEKFQFYSIAQTRSIIHKTLYEYSLNVSELVCWVIDDDMSVDVRVEYYLNNISSFIANNIDVLISPCDGESPNCFYSGLRVQIFDLYENYRWLKQLPKLNILPNRSKENKILREQYPDYYYDLSLRHKKQKNLYPLGQLDKPYWLSPSYKNESVESAMQRLLDNAQSLLEGRLKFRQLINVVPQEPLKSAYPSTNRGGNTFILNPKTLLTPNLTINFKNKNIRRSDMMWALMNKTLFGYKIVSVNFPIMHHGNDDKNSHTHADKMLDEILGAAFTHALKTIVGEQHNWRFTRDEIVKCQTHFLEEIGRRRRRFEANVIYILKTVELMKDYPELVQFANAFIKKYRKVLFEILKLLDQVSQNISINPFFCDVNRYLDLAKLK